MICPSEHGHGRNRTCYTKHRCRCVPCTTSNREYQRRDRLMHGADVRVSALGTRRRLQALAVMGWSVVALAERTNLHPVFLRRVRSGQKALIARSTARVVTTAFEEISATRNRSRDGVVTSRWAHRRGWVGPLSWDDLDHAGERAKGAA